MLLRRMASQKRRPSAIEKELTEPGDRGENKNCISYLVPNQGIRLLVNFHPAYTRGINHFPATLRLLVLIVRVLSSSLIVEYIVKSISQHKNKRPLATILVQWPSVEGEGGFIVLSVPIEKGFCRDFHLSWWDYTPNDLDNVAPGDRNGPVSNFVVAD